jgi:hypothetical protein
LANRDVSLLTFTTGNFAGGALGIVETTKGRGVTVDDASTVTGISSDYAFHKARALEYASNGSASGAFLYQRLTLRASTQYAFFMTAQTPVAASAGTVTIKLVDGVGGSAITDDEGTANTITFDGGAGAMSIQYVTGFFRTPKVLPAAIYLELAMSGGDILDNAKSMFIDNVVLAPATELYAGGPWVAIFAGSTNFGLGDRVHLDVTNDRDGEIHEWFNRFFALAESGKMLPATTGAETIADGTYIGV